MARGSSGSPSSGVWVLTNRRWPWTSSLATTSSRGSPTQSSHGDRSDSGAGRSASRNTSRAQIICTHVVPCFDRVLMTMSLSRNGNPTHRPLSSSEER